MVATIVVQACSSAATSTAPSAAPSSAASQAAAASPSAAAEPVKLTLWHNYGVESNAKVTDALAKAYMAKNPNVTIELVAQPADNYFALLKTAAISKTGPDLMTMWTGLFALQNQGYLEPLNQYIPLDTLKQFDGINWCSKDLKVETGAICVPLDLQFYNGFYNKELFTKAGITAFPTTWDELYAACDKLKAIGVTPMTYGTGLPGAQRRLLPVLRPQLHDDDVLGRRLEEALQRRDRLDRSQDRRPARRSGPPSRRRAARTTTSWPTTSRSSQFETGKAAMTLEGSWDFSEFQDKLGDKVGVFVPPFNDTQAKGVVEFPGNGFGVTSYSQHKQDAADFLAWMATPEAQKIIADGGLIPTVAGHRADQPAGASRCSTTRRTRASPATR